MKLMAFVVVSVMFASPAFAQVSDEDDVKRVELEQWMQQYGAWQEWAGTWLNRRQWALHPFPYPFWKDNASLFSYVATPRVEPAPPAWLPAACTEWESSAVDDAVLGDACRLLTISKHDDPALRIQSRVATPRTASGSNPRAHVDNTVKTKFFERIHFAGLWSDIQPQGSSAYGLAGVHATIDIRGRWQVYPFPGVMAVSMPNLQGKRMVTIGYDWGFALRLFDMRVPYFDIPARAHLNLTEVWVPEAGQKIEMIGLSFSLKKQP
jgi:hypothetical protein